MTVIAAQTLLFDAYDAALQLTVDALPDVTVFDGPRAALPTDASFIVFGTDDPTSDGVHTSIDQGNQEFVSVGPAARDETFVIWLTLIEASGDDDFAELRARANAHVQALGTAIRAVPKGTGDSMLANVLNQSGSSPGWCGMTVFRLRQTNTSQGIAVHVPISIVCYARV